MSKLILAGMLVAVAIAAPAQARPAKRHHQVAPTYPDSVMLDGKQYKVCKPGQQDDCVQARQAGIMPLNTAHHHHKPGHK